MRYYVPFLPSKNAGYSRLGLIRTRVEVKWVRQAIIENAGYSRLGLLRTRVEVKCRCDRRQSLMSFSSSTTPSE